MIHMKKVVIITADGFEEPEVMYPYYRLKAAGFEVSVATPDAINSSGLHGKDNPYTISSLIKPAKPLDAKNLDADQYDLVVIPGGIPASLELRKIKEVTGFVKAFFGKGKLIASICHGPWVLASADVIRGFRATCYPDAMIEDVKQAGAEYIDDPDNQPVVVDRNIITSIRPRNLPEFMETVISEFDKRSAT